MNKKEIYHLLKRYRYIIDAIRHGESETEICISGRRENIGLVTLQEILEEDITKKVT